MFKKVGLMGKNRYWVLISACVIIGIGIAIGVFRQRSSIKQEEQLPVITVCTVGNSTEDAIRRISMAVSEITRETLGCEVQIIQFSLSRYNESLKTVGMTGTMPDVFAIFEMDALDTWMEEEALLELEDYLEPYLEDLNQYIEEKEWWLTQKEGHTYAIPSSQTSSQCVGFAMRKDICDELEIAWKEIRSLDDLYQVLCKVKEAYPDMDMVVPHNSKTVPWLGNDGLGNDLGVLCDWQSEDVKVENLYASQIFYEYSSQMSKWHEQGLILKDAHLTTEGRTDFFNAGNCFGCFVKMSEVSSSNISRYAPVDIVTIQLSPRIIASNIDNMFWAVNKDTKYEELAADVLNMLFTDYELSKLVAYGQEGIDYDVVEDGYVTSPSDSPLEGNRRWNTTLWNWPSGVPIERWTTNGERLEDTYYYWDETEYESKGMGFLYTAEEVRSEVDRCNLVVERYKNALLSGYLDPDTTIPVFLEELKQAGMERVIRDKQEKLEAWMEDRGD